MRYAACLLLAVTALGAKWWSFDKSEEEQAKPTAAQLAVREQVRLQLDLELANRRAEDAENQLADIQEERPRLVEHMKRLLSERNASQADVQTLADLLTTVTNEGARWREAAERSQADVRRLEQQMAALPPKHPDIQKARLAHEQEQRQARKDAEYLWHKERDKLIQQQQKDREKLVQQQKREADSLRQSLQEVQAQAENTRQADAARFADQLEHAQTAQQRLAEQLDQSQTEARATARAREDAEQREKAIAADVRRLQERLQQTGTEFEQARQTERRQFEEQTKRWSLQINQAETQRQQALQQIRTIGSRAAQEMADAQRHAHQELDDIRRRTAQEVGDLQLSAARTAQELAQQIDALNLALRRTREEARRRVLQAEASARQSRVANEQLRSGLMVDWSKLYIRIGVLESRLGNLDEAEKAFKYAIQLQPTAARAYYNLGILYDDHLENGPEAIKAYEQYLLLAPESSDAKTVRGWVQLLKGIEKSNVDRQQWNRPGIRGITKTFKELWG